LINEIQEANGRLNRIVGNLLDVARLESAKVVPRLDWHDIRDLVQTTMRELKHELAAHPLQIDLPASPTLVRIDFSLIQHALANLLLNAACHTPDGTVVEIKTSLSKEQLLLSVADRGPGIAPEFLPRVFDKFARGTHAPTGGSGLGLTIVKGFVEAHHGTVTVENRPGGGAMFTISLPQTEPSPQIPPEQ
jgi:two-component system sensor histidine kinase KdpD